MINWTHCRGLTADLQDQHAAEEHRVHAICVYSYFEFVPVSFVQHILILRLVVPLQRKGSGTPQENGSFSSPGINKPSQNTKWKEEDVAPVVFGLYHTTG